MITKGQASDNFGLLGVNCGGLTVPTLRLVMGLVQTS